ncbi:hypothetical protein RJ639_039341 [Escallonia herrerae]|uniref:VTT domain-containing protein n=1 Tax=Escallonia herrerae TaxID=1293975 RepID=A0AA89B6A7_9ASTE|nr:hypothetical protein RJ639_039341 [Escallonia herrerae]
MLDVASMFEGDKLFNFMSGLQPCALDELHSEGVSDLPTAIAEGLMDFKYTADLTQNKYNRQNDGKNKDKTQKDELKSGKIIRKAGGYGPAGYALFVAVYAGLEVLAIPAIPLTMSAGLLFGSLTGTILVSISGTVAASVAFLIARYFARERILKLVEGNKKFLAIDKAIGENGFRVVTLLRLSPLLPFSLGNYLYGLTSVKCWCWRRSISPCTA